MHLCYIYSTIPRKTLPFLEYYKTSQTGKFRNRSQSSGQGWMLYILCAKVFYPSTVTMFSPRETLAAGFCILVFSQLIISTAGNFCFFSTALKTISSVDIMNLWWSLISSLCEIKLFIPEMSISLWWNRVDSLCLRWGRLFCVIPKHVPFWTTMWMFPELR